MKNQVLSSEIDNLYQNELFYNNIKATVKSIDSDANVILFGSRARGDARIDSD